MKLMLLKTISTAVLLAVICLGNAACTTAGNSGGATQNTGMAAPAGGGY
jgi:hypothetical protein